MPWAQESKRARKGKSWSLPYRGLILETQFLLDKQFRIQWWCFFCFRCRKVSPQKSMQLEDFNHALLRLIYTLHLAFFTAAAFFLGIELTPVGYFAVIVSKSRLLYKMWSVRYKRENTMLRDQPLKAFPRKLLEFASSLTQECSSSSFETFLTPTHLPESAGASIFICRKKSSPITRSPLSCSLNKKSTK